MSDTDRYVTMKLFYESFRHNKKFFNTSWYTKNGIDINHIKILFYYVQRIYMHSIIQIQKIKGQMPTKTELLVYESGDINDFEYWHFDSEFPNETKIEEWRLSLTLKGPGTPVFSPILNTIYNTKTATEAVIFISRSKSQFEPLTFHAVPKISEEDDRQVFIFKFDFYPKKENSLPTHVHI